MSKNEALPVRGDFPITYAGRYRSRIGNQGQLEKRLRLPGCDVTTTSQKRQLSNRGMSQWIKHLPDKLLWKQAGIQALFRNR